MITSSATFFFTGLFKRAFGRSARSTQKSTYRDLKDPVVLDVCQACEMYQVLAATLTQLKMDIFAGLFMWGKLEISIFVLVVEILTCIIVLQTTSYNYHRCCSGLST